MGRPRKAAANAIAWGDDDPFDYFLAVQLKITHAAVQRMDNDTYTRWRAYFAWDEAMGEHAAKVAAMRARGR